MNNRTVFDQTPLLSGPQQTVFRGINRPHQVHRDILSQQSYTGLKWDSLLNDMEVSYSLLGLLILEHNQYLSYKNLFEFLNPALFITTANKEGNPIYSEAINCLKYDCLARD